MLLLDNVKTLEIFTYFHKRNYLLIFVCSIKYISRIASIN
jgi:hypothetical protein